MTIIIGSWFPISCEMQSLGLRTPPRPHPASGFVPVVVPAARLVVDDYCGLRNRGVLCPLGCSAEDAVFDSNVGKKKKCVRQRMSETTIEHTRSSGVHTGMYRLYPGVSGLYPQTLRGVLDTIVLFIYLFLFRL